MAASQPFSALRASSANSIEQRRVQLQQTTEFAEATATAQARALEIVDRTIENARAGESIPKLRLIASEFGLSTFGSLVAEDQRGAEGHVREKAFPVSGLASQQSEGAAVAGGTGIVPLLYRRRGAGGTSRR